mmetsp:Transcript_29813/g.48047  ORF Transcript_29813/g.48047 Transcript_29813/m.48047 type:complete len:253 (+) Transcript_29813:188-946(+)
MLQPGLRSFGSPCTGHTTCEDRHASESISFTGAATISRNRSGLTVRWNSEILRGERRLLMGVAPGAGFTVGAKAICTPGLPLRCRPLTIDCGVEERDGDMGKLPDADIFGTVTRFGNTGVMGCLCSLIAMAAISAAGCTCRGDACRALATQVRPASIGKTMDLLWRDGPGEARASLSGAWRCDGLNSRRGNCCAEIAGVAGGATKTVGETGIVLDFAGADSSAILVQLMASSTVLQTGSMLDLAGADSSGGK